MRTRHIDPQWWASEAFDGQRVAVALAERDIALVFRFLRSRGFSRSEIAAHTGLSETRIRAIANGTQTVTAYEVLLRIAEGLDIPRDLMGLGLANPLSDSSDRYAPATALPDVVQSDLLAAVTSGVTTDPTLSAKSVHVAQRTSILQSRLGVSASEASTIAAIAGDLIEAELRLDLEIDEDGRVKLIYRHDLLTLSGAPVTRLAREVWFKHADRDIVIEPVAGDSTRVVIQRIHDTPTLAKFACQISPPLLPGKSASFAYTVDGGLFLTEFYWRQAMPRYVHRYILNLRHRSAGRLRSCVAIEEHPDGSENSAAEQLLWDYEGADIVVTLARDHLRPNQAVTLRWDFDGETTRRD